VPRGTNRLALRRAAAQPAQAVLDRRRGAVSAPRRTDALDQGIIEALQENGRESFRAIAGRLGVSEATVRARYARLCEDDILQVVGVTNPLGLGFEQALIGLKTAGSPGPVADSISSRFQRTVTRLRRASMRKILRTDSFPQQVASLRGARRRMFASRVGLKSVARSASPTILCSRK